MISDGGVPMMSIDGFFHPICSHHFSNSSGVNLFCKKLGFESGTVTENDLTSTGIGAVQVGFKIQIIFC